MLTPSTFTVKMCWCQSFLCSFYIPDIMQIIFFAYQLKNYIMKLDKKLLYRTIVELQFFANCYRVFLHHQSDGTHMFKVRKLSKNSSGNMVKYISFALSREQLPKFLDCDPVINYDVVLMSDSDIQYYVNQCKSYGIEL